MKDIKVENQIKMSTNVESDKPATQIWLRIDLHRKLKMESVIKGVPMTKLLIKILEDYFNQTK